MFIRTTICWADPIRFNLKAKSRILILPVQGTEPQCKKNRTGYPASNFSHQRLSFGISSVRPKNPGALSPLLLCRSSRSINTSLLLGVTSCQIQAEILAESVENMLEVLPEICIYEVDTSKNNIDDTASILKSILADEKKNERRVCIRKN